MKTILEPIKEAGEFEELSAAASEKEGILSISGCLESQKVHLAYSLAEKTPWKLFLTQDEHSARELYEDCRLYDENVSLYPARDLLFFQADVHGNLLLRQRMKTVRLLAEKKPCTVVASIDGCMDYLMPLEKLREMFLSLDTESTVDMQELEEKLVSLGYERVGQVEMPGQFAVRGGILDIYALTEDNPWRIELWGDQVDSIRSFDSASQRSIEQLDAIEVCPAAEFLPKKGAVSFLDYFPEETMIFLDEPNRIAESAQNMEEEFRESCARREEQGQKTLSQDWITSFAALQKKLNARGGTAFSALEPRKEGWRFRRKASLTVKSIGNYNSSFELLVKDLLAYKKQGYRVLLLSGSRTRAERLAKDLQEQGLAAFYSSDMDRQLSFGELMVSYGHIHRGFEYPLIRFAVIAESDIFGREQTRKKKKAFKGKGVRNFAELSIGDYVIHERHGLGIYRGLEKVEVDGIVKDYIRIEYASGGSLFIPATQLDSLQKYGAMDMEHVPKLNRLGGQEWSRTKTKVRHAVADIARDLVDLYASRQQKEGYVCGPDTVWQREFEEMFPYEETPDQLSAIEDTKRDMESPRIMDRLICGDVGYGKTEVALRAAFKEVQESRQVVYLVPTTILAQQHYNTFLQRMKDFPVRVDLLCRFRTPAQQKKTIQDLKKGLVDIVIGTHRVLSKDVEYKNLGLLIIDEEQRFGVTHKEKIKQLRRDVDVLTLTATPIPRTLHMSLVGIRDMSLLEEPPMDRVPIQTYVMEYDDETVREAITRELRRKGQVYYVYNRVNDIADVASRLGRLVPEARIGFAHGQMTERELEQVMYQFIEGELDILVSTTIIETGLDISNANTMIIHDSDRYGLSQLYQLRGRIGRSNRTAYAFLMYRQNRMLRETAEKRLAAIREYSDLGSGFRIAMRDLEIRGAGNLLGAQQSGHMNAVGYDLYCKMLSEAVKEVKGIHTMADFDTAIDLEMDAFIPDSYIPNEYQKLDIYKRIALIESRDEYEEMLDELLDRFGDPPKSVTSLLEIALLKAQAHQAYITEIKQMGQGIRISFYQNAKLNPAGLPGLISRYNRRLTFVPGPEPRLSFRPVGNIMTELSALIREIQKLVEE